MLRLLLKVQSLATGKACQVQRAVIAILEEPGSRDPMFVFRTTALRSPAWSRADPETHTSPPDCRPQPRKPQFLMSTRCHDVIDHASPSEKFLCEEELIWSRNMLVRVSASELDVEESGRTAGSFVPKLKRETGTCPVALQEVASIKAAEPQVGAGQTLPGTDGEVGEAPQGPAAGRPERRAHSPRRPGWVPGPLPQTKI